MRDFLVRLIQSPLSLFLPVLLWGFVVGLIYVYNSGNLTNAGLEMARQRGEVAYQLVENIRHWNAGHGGVYVPMTEKTPENIWLNIPEKTIQTPQGVMLTRLNPAYMTRQLADSMRGTDLEIHLTSDHPDNPANLASQPDEWEAIALKKIKNDLLNEYVAIVGNRFRYMAPLYIDETCLGCHANLGFEMGDIKGGLSVSFPVHYVEKLTFKLFEESRNIHLVAFVLLSLTGVISLLALRRLVTSLQSERSQREAIIVERTASLNKEIKERRKSEQQLDYLAHHDELTRIKNRRRILQDLKQLMAEALALNTPLAILLLDLDLFKMVNDNHGHDTGDQVLCEFAKLIQTHLRQQDFFGRYGGEEFLVILPATQLEEANTIAQQLGKVVAEQTFTCSELKDKITTSIGIAMFSATSSLSAEELINRADQALYQAKASGRNCYKAWQEPS